MSFERILRLRLVGEEEEGGYLGLNLQVSRRWRHKKRHVMDLARVKWRANVKWGEWCRTHVVLVDGFGPRREATVVVTSEVPNAPSLTRSSRVGRTYRRKHAIPFQTERFSSACVGRIIVGLLPTCVEILGSFEKDLENCTLSPRGIIAKRFRFLADFTHSIDTKPPFYDLIRQVIVTTTLMQRKNGLLIKTT